MYEILKFNWISLNKYVHVHGLVCMLNVEHLISNILFLISATFHVSIFSNTTTLSHPSFKSTT